MPETPDQPTPATPAGRTALDAFRSGRTEGQARLEACDHLGIKRFLRLDAAAYEGGDADGRLDNKTQELLGLVASLVLRCDDCISYHVERCVTLGWTRREIEDAMNVGMIVGGSITIPHIRRALLFMDACIQERASPG